MAFDVSDLTKLCTLSLWLLKSVSRTTPFPPEKAVNPMQSTTLLLVST